MSYKHKLPTLRTTKILSPKEGMKTYQSTLSRMKMLNKSQKLSLQLKESQRKVIKSLWGLQTNIIKTNSSTTFTQSTKTFCRIQLSLLTISLRVIVLVFQKTTQGLLQEIWEDLLNNLLIRNILTQSNRSLLSTKVKRLTWQQEKQ